MRTVCPYCGGGRTREKSFVTTTENGVTKYICHRGSCGKSGVSTDPTLQVPVADRYVRPVPETRTPSKKALQVFRDKYYCDDSDLSRLRPMACEDDTGHPRWWYPIFGPHGSTHGGVARSFERRPKTISYIEEGYSLGSWYVVDGADTVVLVEDQVSAARLGKYVTTVALMGCHLNNTLMLFLAKHTKHLKICLDFDALDKAVKMAEKVAPYFHTTQVLTLNEDVKNMTPEALREYVESNHLC